MNRNHSSARTIPSGTFPNYVTCEVAGIATGFNDQVVWKWAKEFYVDYFGILTSLEDVMDDRLVKELSTHTHTEKFKNLSLCTKQTHLL